MAIRRSKQKAQVVEELRKYAPAGEVFIATVHCETGPSPWLNAIFDEVPVLGLVVALMRRFYFVTLTNTSVVINTASRMRRRPGAVVASWPRAEFPVSNAKRGAVWSKIYVQLPGGAKPTRLNVDRYWRKELDQILAAFPAAADAAPPPPRA